MSTRIAGTLGRTLVAALGIFSSACIPVVNHGPQIEPGWNGGLTASLPVGPRYGNGDWGNTHYLFGPVGVNLAHGWRSGPEGSALLIGVHAPASLALFPPGFFELAQADAYYQLPARVSGSLDTGIGVNLASAHFMPYVQLGRIGANGSGWYTTQGVTVMWDDDNVTSTGSSAIFWMPTIAYQMGKPAHSYHWFVSGGVGKVQETYCYEFCSGIRLAVSAGVSVQFHRQR
ncbi:MAG: hypothetical protein WEE89_06515 [Gemmatimonadota bacterium]